MTMMNKLMKMNAIYIAVLALIPGAQSFAQSEEQVLEQLDVLLNGISTLTADVSQLIVESDGGVLEESEILMKLKRPDGFYWETVSPFPELIVTDGLKLWNYSTLR